MPTIALPVLEVNRDLESGDNALLFTEGLPDINNIYENEEKPAVCRGHCNCVNSAVYSPDGMCIASVSDDNTISIWDSRSYEQLYSVSGHYERVNSVDFHPNGGRLTCISV